MQKLFYTILLLLFTISINAQEVFNRIIEDTIAHITSSIISVDTGFVVLTGTGNEYGVRCFALTYVNDEGIKIWKEIYGNEITEYWEGYNNSIKKSIINNSYYNTGAVSSTTEAKQGVFLYVYDSLFNIISNYEILYDSIWKSCYNVVQSFDSCYYLIGGVSDPNNYNAYTLLIKISANGNLIWHYWLGYENPSSPQYEYGTQIISTSDKNLLIGGVTRMYNDRDWYLLKTDTSGTVLWELGLGHHSRDDGGVNGIIETSDSCYLACGGYPAAIYGSGSGETLWDGCLRKISREGEVIWERFVRSYYVSHTGSIFFNNSTISIVEKNNHFYILGSNYDYIPWLDRGYLCKMELNGNICWKRNYYAIEPNSYDQYLKALKPTNDGGFILAGYGNTYNYQGYDPPQQAWLVKTDSLGMDGLCNTEPDELNLDIEIPEIPESICSDDTIQVYVHISGKSAPYTLEFSTGQVIDSIYYPPTFVPIEIGLTDINLQWNNQTYFEETITEATLSNHEWGQCIVKPVEFYTPATLGTHEIQVTVTDAYGESTSITKNVNVVQCSTFNEIEQKSGIRIYPNPTNDFIHIETANPAYSHAEIFDILGQLILTTDIKQENNSIDIRNLFPGSYVIKLSGKSGESETLFFEKE
jgi:hypothetical protein